MANFKEYINSHFEASGLAPLPRSALFLVGSNPLPVYVAGVALQPEKILLLGTSPVSKIIESLKQSFQESLKLEDRAVESVTCNPADSCDIKEKTGILLDKLDQNEPCLLFYTAGTKAMAVHSHDKWKTNQSNNHHLAAYLSSDGPSLWFDTIANPFPMWLNDKHDVIELSFDDIIKIHQIKPFNPLQPSKDLFKKDTFLKLSSKIHEWIVSQQANDGLKQYLSLLPPTYEEKITTCLDGHDMVISGELSYLNDKNFKDKSYHTCFPLNQWADIFCNDLSNKTLDGIAELLTAAQSESDEAARPSRSKDRKQWRISALKWIATEWLETWVADGLNRSRLFKDVHESFQYLVPGTKQDAEVDVCAMRGHTPFVFSCTVDKKRLGKHKLFEVRMRGNQLGGEHARTAVICLSESPEIIENELNQGWSGYNTIKVFGIRDIRNQADFKESLKKWISTLETN